MSMPTIRGRRSQHSRRAVVDRASCPSDYALFCEPCRAIPIPSEYCSVLPQHPAFPAAGADEPTGRSITVSHRSAAEFLERHGGAQAAHEHGFAFYRDQIRRSLGRWLMAGNLLTMLLRLTRHQELQHRASINMAAYVLEKEQPFPDVMAANRKDIYRGMEPVQGSRAFLRRVREFARQCWASRRK